MKKLFVAALLAAGVPAAAQSARPAVGVGIGVVPLDSLGILPTVEAYVPLRVAPAFRLEPSLGVFTNDQRTGGIDSTNVTVGIGAFWVTRVAEPTDVYLGGRLKLNFVSVDDGVTHDDETDWTLAAAVGGEHYLGTHFSIGAEAQLGHYQNGRLSGARAVNDYGTFTSGVAFVRFYFK
jgi:hypothetical protein